MPSNQLRILKFQCPRIDENHGWWNSQCGGPKMQNAVRMSTYPGEPELRELNKSGANSTAAGPWLGKMRSFILSAVSAWKVECSLGGWFGWAMTVSSRILFVVVFPPDLDSLMSSSCYATAHTTWYAIRWAWSWKASHMSSLHLASHFSHHFPLWFERPTFMATNHVSNLAEVLGMQTGDVRWIWQKN